MSKTLVGGGGGGGGGEERRGRGGLLNSYLMDKQCCGKYDRFVGVSACLNSSVRQ